MSDLTDSPTVLAGRYLLQREIGRGGMGAVYLARDLKHDSRVAVKLLGDGFGSAGSVDRFLGEVRTTARLNHPHILTVHDSGQSDGELYYVMPHVEGASLRERLERETRLPIIEALRIACQVGSALAYAHAHGVIHRDIKPDNILLDPRGHPYVMDFGLARALSSVTAGRATARGIAVGSPHYMSPEQAAGESVDGRSDIYALGCVLFEMLAGEPPFPGPNAQAVLHRHLTAPPPSLKARRADIPDALERTVRTALAKQPDERQVSADQLVHEIEAVLDSLSGRAKTEARPSSAPSGRRRSAMAVTVVVVGAIMAWAVGSDRPRLWFGGAPPDSTRWLIMPLQWSAGSEPPPDRAEDRHLYAAFDRWADLDVVSRLTVAEEIEERGGGRALTAGVGFDLARNLDAGRLVQGLATRLGDSVQIDLTMSDVGGERRPISQLSMRVPADGSTHPHYALAADSLVFGRVTWSDGPEWDIGTRSAAARQAYGAARDGLDAWQIERADSLFRMALEEDPSFARAHFWAAQLASWRARPGEAWLPSARFAFDQIANLATRERILAAGLVALGEGRYPDACESYRQLVQLDDRDFAAWFGFGECITGDDRVVRDARSPSGWRFRASYHSGVEAYVEAFRLSPGSYHLFTEDMFERLPGQIFFTRENVRREGFSEDGRRFSARPQWLSDSLVLVPFAHRRGQPHPDPSLAGTDEALLQHRLVFRDVTRGWSAPFPRDPHVLQAVALSLECLGDEAALDTLLLARRLARTPSHRLELAVREVWLRVKLDGTDETDLVAARVLADSILDAPDARARLAPDAMATLAVLIGRPSLAAAYSGRDAPVVRSEFPSSVARPAAKLLAYSAVGGPADSIASYAALTRRAIANGLPADDRDAAHRSLLERPLILAFDRTRGWRSAGPGDYQLLLSRGQAMLLAGDTAGALVTLMPYRLEPGGTLDMAFSAAALATLAGDTATALANLDTVFDDLRWMHPRMVEEVGHAGALVRAMALRAELAAAADDSSAAHWAASVIALWGDGEPAVAPVIAAMRRIAD